MIELTVPNEQAGWRLDRYLALALPQFSRSRLQALIRAGDVHLQGETARTRETVHAGDVVRLTEPPVREIEAQAEEIPLQILFEDDDLLVLNKPAGLVVHPGAGNQTHTLVNALLHHCANLSGIGGKQRPGIVHRLDKETSGCLVVAKNDAAHQHLSRQFAEREVKKIYLALVAGDLETTARHNRRGDRTASGATQENGRPSDKRPRRPDRLPGAASRRRRQPGGMRDPQWANAPDSCALAPHWSPRDRRLALREEGGGAAADAARVETRLYPSAHERAALFRGASSGRFSALAGKQFWLGEEPERPRTGSAVGAFRVARSSRVLVAPNAFGGNELFPPRCSQRKYATERHRRQHARHVHYPESPTPLLVIR